MRHRQSYKILVSVLMMLMAPVLFYACGGGGDSSDGGSSRSSAFDSMLGASADGSGGLIFSDSILIANAADHQDTPDAAYDTQHDLFLVVWADARTDDATGFDIYGALVSSTTESRTDAVIPGSEKLISVVGTTTTAASGDQFDPSIAYDHDEDQFLVAWTDNRNKTGQIYGQFLFINASNPSAPYIQFRGGAGNFLVSQDKPTVIKYEYDSGYKTLSSSVSSLALGSVSLGTSSDTFYIYSALPGYWNPALSNKTSSNTSIVPGSLYVYENGSQIAKDDSFGGFNSSRPGQEIQNTIIAVGDGITLYYYVELPDLPQRSSVVFKHAVVNPSDPNYGYIDTNGEYVCDATCQANNPPVKIAQDDGNGGVVNLQAVPFMDDTKSKVTYDTGRIELQYRDDANVSSESVLTTNGVASAYTFTLDAPPIEPGTLVFSMDGTVIAMDDGSGDILDVDALEANYPIDTAVPGPHVNYATGQVTLSFTSPVAALKKLTAAYSSEATPVPSGTYLLMDYSVDAESDVLSENAYIDYGSGLLYLEYNNPVSSRKDITVSFSLAENSFATASSTWTYDTQEAPYVIYNDVKDAFFVAWLDSTDEVYRHKFVYSGTSVCTYNFSDAVAGDGNDDSDSNVFITDYMSTSALDNNLVRYRAVTYADMTGGDNAYYDYVGGGSYACDSAITTFDEAMYSAWDADRYCDYDTSPIDSVISAPSRLAFVGDSKLYSTCSTASEVLTYEFTVFDMQSEGSPKLIYKPTSGQVFAVWAGMSDSINVTMRWSRSGGKGAWTSWTTEYTYADGEPEYMDDGMNIKLMKEDYGILYTQSFGTDADSTKPAVAFDKSGGYLLTVWQSEKGDPAGSDIYAQLIDMENFQPFGGTITISNEDYDQTSPVVSFDTEANRYVVAWQDARNEESNISNFDIYVQFVDPTGQLSGGNAPVTVQSGNQLMPALAVADKESRRFLVTWKDASDPSDSDIRGQYWLYSVAPQLMLTDENDAPLTTQTLSFDPVYVTQSEERVFRIWNKGNAILNITNTVPGSGVSLTPNENVPFNILTKFPSSVNPGQYYSLTVRFQPLLVDAYTGSDHAITIESDGGTQILYFSGAGEGGTVEIVTEKLGSGIVNTVFTSVQLEATGGLPPYEWETLDVYTQTSQMKAGGIIGFPPGLSIKNSTGLISGTPTTEGYYYFTVVATDDSGQPGVKEFSIQIVGVNAMYIESRELAEALLYQDYSETIVAIKGSANFSWEISDGALPTGLTLNAGLTDVVTITGQATAFGTYDFTLKVTDSFSEVAEQDFTIEVVSSLKILNGTSEDGIVPNGYVGRDYNFEFRPSGNNTYPYTWEVSAGSLPDGLSLHRYTGVVSGSPTSPGTYYFTLKLTDNVGDFTDKSLSITVEVLQPRITTTGFTNGTVGEYYESPEMEIQDGLGPFAWSIVSGALPDGLYMDSLYGIIYGTPIKKGDFTFTVRATGDSLGGASNYDDQAYTLSIDLDAVTVTSAALDSGRVGNYYEDQLTATGGMAPYTWTSSDTLPAGLSLRADGIINGTPSASGTFEFRVTATDSYAYGAQTGSSDVTLSISSDTDISIVTESLPKGEVDKYYEAELEAQDGNPPYTWGVLSGSLPPGLEIEEDTGLIFGTPTTSGDYSVTIAAYDSSENRARKTYSMSISGDGTDGDSGGGGTACFIATAAYGSYMEDHVMTLRRFRDRRLLTNPMGEWFVERYYTYSPPIADYIAGRAALRAVVRTVLTPVVYAIEYPGIFLAAVVFAAGGGCAYGVRRRAMRVKGRS